MKKSIFTLITGLLLAVGWTTDVQAQKLPQVTPSQSPYVFKSLGAPSLDLNTGAQPSEHLRMAMPQPDAWQGKDMPQTSAPALRAPRRAYTVTADVVHPKSWYDGKGYYWVDANNQLQTASYTQTVTDPNQMYWFIRSIYQDTTMPGIRHSVADEMDVVYQGVDFGYWISGPIDEDINIYMTYYTQITAIYVYDFYGNLITSIDADNGNTMPTGWTMMNSSYMTRAYDNTSGWYYWTFGTGSSTSLYNAFQISPSILVDENNETLEGVQVLIVARQTNSSTATTSYTASVGLHSGYYGDAGGQRHSMGNSWSQYVSKFNAPITPPDENGYSVVLVKLTNDFDFVNGQTEAYTLTDSALISFYDKYVDELQLLTDGLRVGDGDDAGTIFSYSGSLNRFYFISKGKTYQMGSSENAWQTNTNNQYVRATDFAPFYAMFEEFSPTTTTNTTGITDFYSRMLEGESYDIIHDCQGVCRLEHFFSMTGKEGTENRSLSNLILYIPDNRGQAATRDYNEEYLPQVGLYTIQLTAEATRAADYSESNRKYDVTCNWVSSLNKMLDFNVPQTYELWRCVYDEHGNPVEDSLLVTTNDVTTFTYQVDQYPESYTIIYRVTGWPTNASNGPLQDGDFFAVSNVDDVLIPGYNDFLALKLDHYESDFVIEEEHNYYRNFFSLANQNPDNVLTAGRVLNGENLFTLYRYDVDYPAVLTKAADLELSQSGNDIRYNITYANQNILTGYDLATLGIPTSGVVATLGGGDNPPTPVEVTLYEKITSLTDLTSGEKYLIVYETNSRAFNGGLTTLDATGNYIGVTITDNTIPADATTDAASFTITQNGDYYRIRGASGVYIGRSTNSNGITTSTTATTNVNNTITFNNGNVNIKGTATRYLRYNTQTNQFRYLSNTGGAQVQLYKRVTKTITPGGGGTTSTITSWNFATTGVNLPNGWVGSSVCSADQANSNSIWLYGDYTITIPQSMLSGYSNITVTINAGMDEGYANQTNYNQLRVNGTAQTVNSETFGDYTWTGLSNDADIVISPSSGMLGIASITITGTTAGGGGTGDYTLLSSVIDNQIINISGIVTLTEPWSGTGLQLQSSGSSAGYFYITNSGSIQFTVPAGYNGADLKFVVHNAPSSSGYYAGTFTFTSSSGETHSVTCNTADTDYEAIFQNVSPGDVITVTGTCGTANYSPDFSRLYVYVQGGSSGVDMDEPLYLADIEFVDQFKAPTATDTHPYLYGYVLKYEPAGENPKSSSVGRVPVQHTGATPDGYYTLNQIDTDRDLSNALPVNVMNAQMEMQLANNFDVFYYTLDRKPSTDNNAQYEEISRLQNRTNGTYQEMDRLLTQYIDSTYRYGSTPRHDTYNVQYGPYNSYMNYVPIVWTHGDLSSNKRIKWETEKLHNSYGAPIWKTGVGQVNISEAISWQQSAGGAQGTSWTDQATGGKAWIYFLTVEADGILPTLNNVPYEPYLFRVWVNSPSGKLRGWNYVQAGENVGAHFEGDGNSYTSLMLYEGLTTDGHLSIPYDDQLKFAGLENINDLEVVVRFYYVVQGAAQGHVFNGRAMTGPAGYAAQGAKSPDPQTAVNEIYSHGQVLDVTYVNTMGQQSSKPFDGVNIVVTRYSDGTTTTGKMLRR